MKIKHLILSAFCIAALSLSSCSSEICENNCPFSNDGICDDSGPDATTNQCEYGYDCNDCGTRPRKR